MIHSLYIILLVFLIIKKEVIMETLAEEDLDRFLRVLNKDKNIYNKKRFGILVFGIFIGMLIGLKNKYVSILVVIVSFKYPYWVLKKEVKRLISQVSYEFPIWLRQIQCLLQSNTVLNSVAQSIQGAPHLMKPYLEDLVLQLRQNPMNFKFYQDFMAHYDLWLIQNSMQNLYRYNFVNQNEAHKQLTMMNESTGVLLKSSQRKKQERYINSHTYLAFIPMLAVSFLFIVLMSLVMKGMFEGGWVS